MTLGEFIKNFSHNNIVRLLYRTKSGHEVVLDSWDDVSMDHEILRQKSENRHFIDNKVIGLASVLVLDGNNREAINIVIEKLENQPMLDEVIDDRSEYHESC